MSENKPIDYFRLGWRNEFETMDESKLMVLAKEASIITKRLSDGKEVMTANKKSEFFRRTDELLKEIERRRKKNHRTCPSCHAPDILDRDEEGWYCPACNWSQ